ncbi:hypothetical protein Nepgr_012015 [Nepenthes gracilis]|uniref:C2H2-type domain-containing protein n=1 Tax=Nepenthes gracilis TaxID=150966 RepID=A0AAD3SGD1_NEPGR|nr:hypothetical protein Nepgr_012015 [Nepenthes gracilis]
MENSRCWLWAKRRQASDANSDRDNLWEERAFAEDAAGLLGGCVWPQRSYPCKFCMREFRSAQALGGHMNVHRGDRARLTQLPPQEEILQTVRHNDSYPYSSSLGVKDPPQNHSVVKNPNPSSDPCASYGFCATSRDRIRRQKAEEPVYFTPVVREKRIIPCFPSFSCLTSCNSNANGKNQEKKKSVIVDLECQDKEDHSRICDLSISLSLIILRTRNPRMYTSEDDTNCYKRRKMDTSTAHRDDGTSMAHKLDDSSSLDELDLELRLGYQPKL